MKLSFLLFVSGALLLSAAPPVPVFFEPNHGQAPPQAGFVARQGPRTSLLSASSAELMLGAAEVKLTFVGAANAKPLGIDRQAGESNYLHGNDPAVWKKGIAHFGGVRYTGIYDGVDLVYHASPAGALEYDFVVAAGADPSRIGIRMSKVDAVRIEPDGSLHIDTKAGPVIQHQPVAYQEIGGERRTVEVSFQLDEEGGVRFALGEYDHSHTLVIDPTLDYSSYFGGPGGSAIADVKVDLLGNVYMAGEAPPPFSTGSGSPFTGTSSNPLDAWVMKFSPRTNQVLFFTSFGGSSQDGARSVAVDAFGNVVIGGYTISPDIPLKNPVHVRNKAFLFDGFIAKFTANGQNVLFSTYLGGNGSDNLARVMSDVLGNTYICGDTLSTDFPSQNGLPTQFPNPAVNSLAFLTKLSPAGAIVYSGLYGGSQGPTTTKGCAIDLLGQVYLAGSTFASDFPLKNPLPGTATIPSSFTNAASWLTKVGNDGKTVKYSTFLTSGGNISLATAVSVDLLGEVVVAGYTNGHVPVHNAIQATSGGGAADGFVVKVNALGTNFVYATYLGGSGLDLIWGVATTLDGTAYVAGYTASSDFVLKKSVQPYKGGQDSFVTAISSSGDRLVYSSLLGGTGNEYTQGIAVDLFGNAYVVGMTRSSDFPTKDAYQATFPTLTNPNGTVGYLYKLSADH